MNRYSIFICFLFFPFLISAQSGTWTWMHGSYGATSIGGSFGTIGVAAPGNDPPGMYESASWTDLNGNFWIFGGKDGASQYYSALWKFDVASNMWTWMKGPSAVNQTGVYGVQGVPSPANTPGARTYGAATWTDDSGNLWLFGGWGYDVNGAPGNMNDMWEYIVSSNEWVWMKGPNTNNGPYSYGTLQVASASNCPPARAEATAAWKDTTGGLWIYGGDAVPGLLSDMWRYDTGTNTWTWMSGTSTANVVPNCGTLQVGAATNTPGGGWFYGAWTDRAGKFWLFGGGPLYTSVYGTMWEYDPATNFWTWMAGSSVANDSGSFTQPCTTANEFPEARAENKARWTDGCGRFWQFGGFISTIYSDRLNDMWMFDPSTMQFTFAGGSTLQDQPGNFGTILVPSSSNYPDAAGGNSSFIDAQGNFWMFGGLCGGPAYVGNTLWKYEKDESCLPGYIGNIEPVISESIDSGSCFTSFHATATFPAGVNYQWDFGDPSSTSDTSSENTVEYTYMQPGIYHILIHYESSTSCQSGDTDIVVACTADHHLFFPNVFTPDHNGVNDEFPGTTQMVDDYHLEIYDRYGIQLYETDDPVQNWDGKYNGNECVDGVYYWVARYSNCNGTHDQETGFVHLIR